MDAPKYVYRATYLANYDGDTIDLNVDLGFQIAVTIRVRLLGVDTPELRGVDEAEKTRGLRAKEFTREFLEGKEVVVRTYKDKKGKYGRWLAELWVGQRSLGEALQEAGLAGLS
jgi:micrococcal nuclease